jgi:hypothetical protein
MSRSREGSARAEAFLFIAIATILLTRLYLRLTGYPQVGGGNLHIAHSLYGEVLMMLALLVGWLLLGAGVRNLAVMLGGIGFGLALDEVGKFVTKTNDYFYGPAAEIMYVLVVVVLVGTRALRTARPLSGRECLSSAALIAADGVARGLGDHRRQLALRLIEQSRRAGVSSDEVDAVEALVHSTDNASDRLYRAQCWARKLIPGFVDDPRWASVVGWLVVASAVASIFFHSLGAALGGYFFRDSVVDFHLAGMGVGTAVLLGGAVLTLVMALPAVVALRRSDSIRPLRWLRDATLLFTLLSAFVHFATEGFAALINLALGLVAMSILSRHIGLRERAAYPTANTQSASH